MFLKQPVSTQAPETGPNILHAQRTRFWMCRILPRTMPTCHETFPVIQTNPNSATAGSSAGEQAGSELHSPMESAPAKCNRRHDLCEVSQLWPTSRQDPTAGAVTTPTTTSPQSKDQLGLISHACLGNLCMEDALDCFQENSAQGKMQSFKLCPGN